MHPAKVVVSQFKINMNRKPGSTVYSLGSTGEPWKLVRMPRNTSTELPPRSYVKNVSAGDIFFIDYERGGVEIVVRQEMMVSTRLDY